MTKSRGREFSLPLCLDVNQFAIHNFHSPITNVIHPADPLHLVVCIELLGDTFRLSHLLYQPKKHFLCLTVDIGKVAVQLSTGEQGCIGCPVMLFQVTPMGCCSSSGSFRSGRR